jgi:translocation and assembly module TamA
VTLAVEPGPLYRFNTVEVPGLPAAQSAQIPVKAADPVNADAVRAAEIELQAKLMREGYPFAKVGDPAVTIDHETRAGTLALNVDAGGKRNFGGIRITNPNPPFGPKHVQTIARFRPGQLYNQELVDDLRRALVATGLLSTVRVAPVEGAAAGSVDIATTIEPAPMRTIAGAVTFRGVAGTKEQSLGALLRMSNFRRRDQVLNASLVASHQQLPAYDAVSLELGANLERQTNIIWQKKWVYSFGFEVAATREQDFVQTVGIAQRRTYFIGALPLTLGYDGSDDLLDPKRGFRLSGRLSPEASISGKTFGYVRAQIDGSAYYPVNDRLVIAGRARIGSTVGAAREDIAPSRRFYAGGGGSVRGFGYQEIGARNVLNQPVGGRSLAEFSLEARVRLPMFGGNFGVVPFVDAGNVYAGSFPTFSGLRIGAGLGLRYYSNFGPIRIDVGTPLGRRPGESLIAVQVSLGQAF